MAPMYYRNASAAMLVYDVTNSKSFEDIRGWVTELQSNTEEGTCTSWGSRTRKRGPES